MFDLVFNTLVGDHFSTDFNHHKCVVSQINPVDFELWKKSGVCKRFTDVAHFLSRPIVLEPIDQYTDCTDC